MNCRRLGKMLLLSAIVSSLVWVVPAGALNSNARIVRLSYISGDVQLDHGQGQGYERAILNMPVVQGSRLLTRGDDALAEVEFEDGSTLRLTPGTTVVFQELSLRGSGQKVTSVNVESGSAYFDVRSQMGDFRVLSGGQQISVPHAARFRVFADNGQFNVADYKGNLDLRSGDNQIAIRSGETFALDPSDPGHYNLAKGVAEDPYDNWNQEREDYTQSYNSAGTYSAAADYGGFSPAYSYGLADLAYYGNYFYAPGWGWMWRPYYVGAGWNPFMDGAWAWYPQFGYMWVSPYPWGWMPYRYGAWNFVPGYGWCWTPATVWNQWSAVTAVNHPPVNWVPVRPPVTAPKPGTIGLVTVGRTLGTVYPPGSVRTMGNSLVPSATPSQPLWKPSGSITGKSLAPNTGITQTGKPIGGPARGSRPSAPAPRMGPSPAGAHSWGGGHAGGSGGGHSGGGMGGHSGGHR